VETPSQESSSISADSASLADAGTQLPVEPAPVPERDVHAVVESESEGSNAGDLVAGNNGESVSRITEVEQSGEPISDAGASAPTVPVEPPSAGAEVTPVNSIPLFEVSHRATRATDGDECGDPAHNQGPAMTESGQFIVFIDLSDAPEDGNGDSSFIVRESISSADSYRSTPESDQLDQDVARDHVDHRLVEPSALYTEDQLNTVAEDAQTYFI